MKLLGHRAECPGNLMSCRDTGMWAAIFYSLFTYLHTRE